MTVNLPDCCLGPQGNNIPTLVLKTGVFERLVHNAKTWVLRLLPSSANDKDLDGHGVQWVILLNINQNVRTLLQEAMQAVRTCVDAERAGADAITISIWQNKIASTTDNFKVSVSKSDRLQKRPGITALCVSQSI